MPLPRVFVLVAALIAMATSVFAQVVPSGGTALYTGEPPTGFGFYGGTQTTVATPGTPHANGWRFETKTKSVNAWDVGLSGGIPRAVNKGDRGLVHFWVRTIQAPADPDGLGKLTLIVQRGSGDYARSLAQPIWAGTAWKEYFVPFEFGDNFAVNAATVGFELGYNPQIVEVAGFQVYYYGTARTLAELPITSVPYVGMEPNAAWRATALARIEQIRKGNFSVRLTDAQGAPIPGVKVKLEMKKHAFPFGAAIQGPRLNGTSANDRMYQRKFLEYFNAGGPENDLKWQPLAGDWGSEWTPARAQATVAWLANRGLPARGHVMVWPGPRNLPKAINDLVGTTREKEIPDMVLNHIDEVSALTKGLVTEWDVQNEPADNNLLMQKFGDGIMTDWFKRAAEKNPGVRLYLNDYSNHDIFDHPNHIDEDDAVIASLKSNNAPISGFGIQGHLNFPTPPTRLLATFDHFASKGLPIHVTEFDFDTNDEALLGSYTKDFLIACFSHPAVVGVQHWGFWQDAHWLPRAAMFRSDWSERPNAAAFRDLVHDQWRTRLELTTDANGEVRGRGFLGDYVASAVVGGQSVVKTFNMTSNTGTASVQMKATPARLINLSTRALVGGSLDPLIVGIVIGGTQPKKMVIRGAGPALSKFQGVGQVPTSVSLRLYDAGKQEIAFNNGWGTAPDTAAVSAAFAQVGAFAFEPNSGDSALLVTLAPGTYYAHIDSPDAFQGAAIAEAYEIETADASPLENLSCRGYVGADGKILFPGWVVRGPNSARFLIRAVGPGLDQFDVTNTVDRPVIQLFKDGRVIQENGGWEINSNVPEIEVAPGFKLSTADAAILVTLEEGSYTAQIKGLNGTVGNVLLELYRLP